MSRRRLAPAFSSTGTLLCGPAFLVSVLMCLVAPPQPSWAQEPVCVEFTAQVDETTLEPEEIFLLNGTITGGQILFGTYLLDASAEDIDPNPEVGVYPHRVWPYIMSVVVVPDSFVMQSVSLAVPEGDNVLTNRVEDGMSADSLQVASTRNRLYLETLHIEIMQIKLVDPSGTAIVGDDMPTGAPELGSYDQAYLEVVGYDIMTEQPFDFRANIIEIVDRFFCAGLVLDEMVCAEHAGQVIDVDDPGNLLGGAISPGDPFIGRYVFNLQAADTNEPDPQVGQYNHLAQIYGMLIDIQGTQFVSDPVNVDFPITILDNLPGDVYFMESLENVPMSNGVSVERMFWDFRADLGGTIESDAIFGPPDPINWPDLNQVKIEGGGNQSEGFTIEAEVFQTGLVPCDPSPQAPTDAGAARSFLSTRAAPNPFVRTTRIHFMAPQAGPMHVAVFDARGRLVRVLLRGEQRAAGPASVVWDGRTQRGLPAGRGIYYYRVRAGGTQHVGRVLLLR